MKKLLPDGREVEVVDVQIKEERTPWCTFKLEDGTTLKVRLDLVSVLRAVDVWHPGDGNPIYFYSSNLTVRISAPKGLKAQSIGEKEKKSGPSPEIA